MHPATQRLADLVAGTPDDALGRPTPCRDYTVAALLHHIGGAAQAFYRAAVKQPRPGGRSGGDSDRLDADWRTQIPLDLKAMAEAWSDPAAWTGMTAAGGVDLPGDMAGAVALDELVIHGWDLAKATGQPAGYDGPGLDAVYGMVTHFRGLGAEGLFGPEVAIPADAPLFERILGLAGRDPNCEPPR